MRKMNLFDHFWCVTWCDEYGDWRDAIFQSHEAAVQYAGTLDVTAEIHPPEPAWAFVECRGE